MARHFETWQSALRRFNDSMIADRRLAPRTISFYRETVHAVLVFMEAHGLPTLPHQIDADAVNLLLDCMAREGLAIATRKGYISALKKYLAAFGNHSMEAVSVRFPHDMRPKVDWLTTEQARRLLSCQMTVLQRTVVHCELCLGLRRVEVIRLQVDDIHGSEGYITVRGKGPQGGKPRAVPFTKDTAAVLGSATAWRMELIESCPDVPAVDVPGNLILWRKAGRLFAYSEEGYGLDKAVTNPLSKMLGFRFSNHTLRRTFGRAMYRADVPVPTIAKILGHESTEVTLRYIGVDLDDMRSAMAVDIYRINEGVNQMAINQEEGTAREKSSPAQICADDSGLAALIFGSNFACLKFSVDYDHLNSACVSIHTHAHTHSHTSESEESAPVSL